MLPVQPNQSLIDGIRCLERVVARGAGVGVRELARDMGLEPTRVHRLLKTLAHLGLTRQEADRKYAVGPAVHVLSSLTLFASGLMHRASGPLEGLRRHGHLVAMGVLWQDHVSYLYHAGPRAAPGEGVGRTALFPASRSSIGRVLLAAQPDAAIRALYRGRPIEGVEGGIDGLLAALRTVRAEGYAEVTTADGRSLAVAVEPGPVAAIALAGQWRAAGRAELVQALRQAAEAMRA